MQARAFRSNDEDDDDTDDDYSDDEEQQSPIDEVDPFVFFVDSVKGKYTVTLAYLNKHFGFFFMRTLIFFFFFLVLTPCI